MQKVLIGFTTLILVITSIAWAAPSLTVNGNVATFDATTLNSNCEAGVQTVKVNFETREVLVYCYGDFELPPINANKIEIRTRNPFVLK